MRRPRIGVQTAMVLVAMVAIVLSGSVELRRRAGRFKALAASHKRQEAALMPWPEPGEPDIHTDVMISEVN